MLIILLKQQPPWMKKTALASLIVILISIVFSSQLSILRQIFRTHETRFGVSDSTIVHK